MSFEESVIIPIDVYRRCRIEKKDEAERLLTDTTIPTDRKMKLYAEAISKKRLRKEKGEETHLDDDDEEAAPNHIELNFPMKDRPLIKSIVDFIHRHRAVVGWDEKDNSLVIDGRIIPDSDILDVLRYFTNSKLASEQPTGLREFYETLIDLGLPSEWIKKKPVTRVSSRSEAVRTKRQKTTTTTTAATATTPTQPSSSTSKKWTSYSTK